MKNILMLFMLLTTPLLWAQKNTKPNAEEQFKTDLAATTVKLYTLGGFRPAITEEHQKNAEKYGITFYDFGCIAPPDLDYYREYNTFVFAYLTDKFGTIWQSEIPLEVLGFSKWKEEHK
jgi:hypothetical protein